MSFFLPLRTLIVSLGLAFILTWLVPATGNAGERLSRYLIVFNGSSRTVVERDSAAWLRACYEDAARKLNSILPKPGRFARPRLLWAARAAAVSLNPAELEQLRKNPQVGEIVPVVYQRWVELPPESLASEPVRFWATEKTRAVEVWEKLGIDGSGVLAGHLDSGANPEHPALRGQIQLFRDFTATGAPILSAYDDQGHGTHTAGCIAGRTNRMGMAPGARLLVARVLDTNGGGTNESILAAMQWMLDPDGNPETNDGPRVVSNSWGSSSTTDRAFWNIIETWVRAGIVPVFAAGNNGYMNGRVGVPAAFPHSLAVGATDERDQWGWFSSIGPAKWDGKTFVKPDVAAPGVSIFSAHWKNDGFNNLSGTSMAAPLVTGLVALMLQANPEMSVEEIKRVIRETAVDLGVDGPDEKFGFGRIDAFAAVQKALTASAPLYRVRNLLARVKDQEPNSRERSVSLGERAVLGLRGLAMDLDEGDWVKLESALDSTGNPFERRALRFMQTVRKFGRIHGN